MFASVLKLDRTAIKEFKVFDTYSLHRVVYGLFDDINSGDSRSIQWVDKGGDFLSRSILIISDRKPREPIHGTITTKEVPESFLSSSSYRFEIVVNPAYRESKSGKVVPVKGAEAIEAWFKDKADQNGFRVTQLEIEGVTVDTFVAKSPVTMQKAKIIGFFDVTDKTKFVNAFNTGIGRCKGFGCGLLQITPSMNSIF